MTFPIQTSFFPIPQTFLFFRGSWSTPPHNGRDSRPILFHLDTFFSLVFCFFGPFLIERTCIPASFAGTLTKCFFFFANACVFFNFPPHPDFFMRIYTPDFVVHTNEFCFSFPSPGSFPIVTYPIFSRPPQTFFCSGSWDRYFPYCTIFTPFILHLFVFDKSCLCA